MDRFDARTYSRVLNVGRTIADSHIAEPFSTEAWTGECGHSPAYRFEAFSAEVTFNRIGSRRLGLTRRRRKT